MNRNEAKTYVLDVLGLDRDQARQFGNLSLTQTWLDAIAAHDEIAPCKTRIVEVTPAIAIPEPAALDTSFEAFWDSAPALLQPLPLLNVSALDGDWDEAEPPASQASEVIVYPIVIGLVMLWAMVQLLLLGGKALCGLLTGLADRLDFLAQERLRRRRELALQPAPALVLALP